MTGDNPMYDQAGELTTPTGAALITTLAAFNRPAFAVDRVGIGLGTKDPAELSNALRVWLGETEQAAAAQAAAESGAQLGQVVLLETNLDDVSGGSVPGVALGSGEGVAGSGATGSGAQTGAVGAGEGAP